MRDLKNCLSNIKTNLEQILAEYEEQELKAKQKFNRLAKEWKKATKHLSNIQSKSVHPAYQKIIGMGEIAIPLILEDLAMNVGEAWFWALSALTENLPTSTEDIAGNMEKVTEMWLKWGHEAGYIILE